jgi:hypothetical protein
MIKIGDLVKFPSRAHEGFVGYGIYSGEDNNRLDSKSAIHLLYFTDPRVSPMSINKPIWHRNYEELKLCTKDEKLQVTLWKLEGVKYPKEKKR